MRDFSGFYYNVPGLYEDVIYYVSPLPEQNLYMIRKYNPIINTNDVLKSIETGFNGTDYEVYQVTFKSAPFDNPDDSFEKCVIVDYMDYSNRQIFEGLVLFNESMPMYTQFYDYCWVKSAGLPVLIIPPEVNGIEAIPKHSKPTTPIASSATTENIETMDDSSLEMPEAKPLGEQLNYNNSSIAQQQAQQAAQSIASQIVQTNANEVIDTSINNQ